MSNTVAYNTNDGVLVDTDSGTSTGNQISGNRIFGNGDQGIALARDGVTANDSGDGDSGVNNLQNFPVVTAASSDGEASTVVTSTLNSVANASYRVEFFASENCETSGYGEGEIYLGYQDVTTDGSGNVAFTATLTSAAPEDYWITATATDSNGNTSEFSACVQVAFNVIETSLEYGWYYEYDPLYRLTYACSSDWDPQTASCGGDFEFGYTYDAVGNRLSKETVIDGQSTVISYTYDIANRLTNVGGVTYTWDDNGNLTNDGVYTYMYDVANRLVGASGQSSVISFEYNGLGDRLSQTVDSVTTYYTLDLAAGLTQVLADGSNTYLYGLGRIAQQDATSTDYFLADALGSVRQLTDGSGVVTLAQSYKPFGEVLNTTGDGASSYGFTGEFTDSTGMIYLRARYYAPWDGRFTTRDIWAGERTRPGSMNRYVYAYNSPLNYTDNSGHSPDCWDDGYACGGDPGIEYDNPWENDTLTTDDPNYEITDPLYMKPRRGIESRGVAAEQGYSDFSAGGYEHPMIAGIGMLNYEWELILQSDWRELAGRTVFGRYVHGGPDAYGVVYIRDLQDGTRVVTDIAISNHTHHDITLDNINIMGFDSNNDYPLGHYDVLSVSDATCYGAIPPGVTSNPITIRPLAYTPGKQYIVLHIQLSMNRIGYSGVIRHTLE